MWILEQQGALIGDITFYQCGTYEECFDTLSRMDPPDDDVEYALVEQLEYDRLEVIETFSGRLFEDGNDEEHPWSLSVQLEHQLD